MDCNLAELNANRRDLFSDPNGGDFIASLIRQLLCAVRHLHLERLRLIHRDIKPSNILVRHEGGNRCHLKLADLGSARQLPPDDDDMISRYVVTRPYRAPEIILTDNYERPVDLWSVGCVLAELIINRVLFDERDSLMLVYCIMQYVGISQSEIQELPLFVQQNVLQNPNRFATNHLEAVLRNKGPQWGSSSIGMTELIGLTQRLLTFSPQNRITAEEALALPFWAPMGNLNDAEDGGNEYGIYVEDTQRRSDDQWKQVIFNQLQQYN
uniref:Protein kinase domain-containing protein n=1 Tax=Panagrolaimus davidi TaxID=227884 RepID=A0A914Q9S1_9BILA